MSSSFGDKERSEDKEMPSSFSGMASIAGKGVLGSKCQTGGQLVGCHQRLEKKKKKKSDFINFLPNKAFLSTIDNYISSTYYIDLKITEICSDGQG
jgi:hypothetical protein